MAGITNTRHDTREIDQVDAVDRIDGIDEVDGVDEIDEVGKGASSTDRGPRPARVVWATARITLGFVFLWSFLDKLVGLGFSTERDAGWMDGGSPTTGFLRFGTRGPLKGVYESMAGEAWVDWLFMLGLVGVGGALTLGIGLRIAAVSGATLMVLLWGATIQPEHNPVVDQHVVYALVLIGLAVTRSGDTFGLGRPWRRTRVVRRFPALV